MFRPTEITQAAILRLSTLAGINSPPTSTVPEPMLDNPTPTYPLYPDRGVEPDVVAEVHADQHTDIVAADDLVADDLDLRCVR